MSIAIAKVITKNRTQVVMIPAEARLPDEIKRVIVRVRGKERIITPIENAWDNFFMSGPAVTVEFFKERNAQMTSKRKSL
jgi:antitoxin VapB